MKLVDKKNKIRVEEEDLTDAKLSSLDFKDIQTRKRAYANVLSARLAMKMLFSQKIEATNLYSLYTIHSILEEFDIADIYFNNIKIDVRLVFSPNEIFIPKSHFKNEILPDIYLVLLARENLNSVEFLGYFEPKELNKNNQNDDYYFFEYDNLKQPDSLKKFLDSFIIENYTKTPRNIENAEELFISFIDKEATDREKSAIIQQLADDLNLRGKVVEFENFEIISKAVAKNNQLFQDGMLDFVGAQKAFEEENKIQSKEEYKADVNAEVLEDVLETADDMTGLALAGTAIAGAAIAGATLAGAAAEASSGLMTPDIDLDLSLDAPNNLDNAHNLSIDEQLDNAMPGFEDDSEFLGFDQDEPSYLKQTDDEAITIGEEIGQFNDSLPELNIDGELQELKTLPEYEAGNEPDTDFEKFDFDELSKETSDENELANDSAQHLSPLSEKEFDTLQEFSKLEEEEDSSSENFIDVDDFLNDLELSDEQKNAIENTLASTMPEFGTSESKQDSDIIFFDEDGQGETNSTQQINTFATSEQQDGDLLQVLFEKEQINGEENAQNSKPTSHPGAPKSKKMLIAASVASIVLVTFVAGNAIIQHKNASANMQASQMLAQGQQNQMPNDPTQMNNPNSSDGQPNAQIPLAGQDPTLAGQVPSGPQEIPGENQQVNKNDMGKAVSDAFLSEPVNASVSKVAWEVPEDLAYNDSFRKYLQMAGRNLKLNIQNSLLLATELAYSNKVVVDLNIDQNGGVQASNLSVSSGSKQIDKIVLQSVKETLSYLKMPASELGGHSNALTLIINF